MKLKKIISALLIVTSMMGITACGKSDSSTNGKSENQSGGTIVIPVASDPDTLNPAFANVKEAKLASNILYSPLYVYEDGKIRTYLADKVDFKDNKELIIKLKENLKWHDGNPITADDIVYTLNLILDEKQNSPSRQTLIVGDVPVTVEKVDDLTVKVILPSESANFLHNMSNMAPIPKHIYEGQDLVATSELNNSPIGSGPFKFKEWKQGESIIFERNNEYFGGTPKADMIALKVIPNETSQEAALSNGELTVMKASTELYNKSKDKENLQTYSFSERRLNYIVFNENLDQMKNLDVRKAISYGLNRKEMINSAYGEEGSKEAKSIFIPEADYYTEENVQGYDFDLEKAKELLTQSGVTIQKLKIGYNTGRFAHKNYALLAQQQLKELGIEVEIVPYESKAFFNVLFSNSKECDLYVNGYAWGLDPNPYRGMFETGAYHNQTAYSNPEVDKLWNAAVAELDDAKREKIYKEIQQKVSEDAAIYTIDYEQNLMIAQKNLSGIEEARSTSAIMFEDWSKLYIKK